MSLQTRQPLSRSQWRFLRVVAAVPDMAHAARKLHWSQAAFKAAVAELQICMGAQHVALVAEQVQLSDAVKALVREQAPCCGEEGGAIPVVQGSKVGEGLPSGAHAVALPSAGTARASARD